MNVEHQIKSASMMKRGLSRIDTRGLLGKGGKWYSAGRRLIDEFAARANATEKGTGSSSLLIGTYSKPPAGKSVCWHLVDLFTISYARQINLLRKYVLASSGRPLSW